MKVLALVMAVLAALALGGCAASDSTSPLEPSPRITSEEQLQLSLRTCMSELGWSGEWDEDLGGYSYEYPSAQGDQYARDVAHCEGQIGAGPRELSREDREAIYELVSELARCFASSGYDIPDVPSAQQFWDGDRQWTPYDYLPTEMAPAEREQLEAACPHPLYL